MTIAIAGSSGLVGTALVETLTQRGDQVRRLVRRATAPDRREIEWDPQGGQVDPDLLENLDALVHLGGVGIAERRWSERQKALIRDSRVDSTRLLSTTLAQLSSPPATFICASAVGYYGDRGDELLTESSPPGVGFLPDVCQQWEQATEPARSAGIRVVNLRIGIVLSSAGGSLSKMVTPFKLGVGGVLGDGGQYLSWITLNDLIRVILFVLDQPSLTGPVNAVAPNAATNRDLTRTLGKVLKRPTIIRSPAFAIRAIFGEMGRCLLLEGCRVHPEKLLAAGFGFEQANLEPALRALLG